jgi:hypothetical protein
MRTKREAVRTPVKKTRARRLLLDESDSEEVMECVKETAAVGSTAIVLWSKKGTVEEKGKPSNDVPSTAKQNVEEVDTVSIQKGFVTSESHNISANEVVNDVLKELHVYTEEKEPVNGSDEVVKECVDNAGNGGEELDEKDGNEGEELGDNDGVNDGEEMADNGVEIEAEGLNVAVNCLGNEVVKESVLDGGNVGEELTDNDGKAEELVEKNLPESDGKAAEEAVDDNQTGKEDDDADSDGLDEDNLELSTREEENENVDGLDEQQQQEENLEEHDGLDEQQQEENLEVNDGLFI